MDVQLGDILVMKKEHPCGEKRWLVLRTGMDIRWRCMGCASSQVTSTRANSALVADLSGSAWVSSRATKRSPLSSQSSNRVAMTTAMIQGRLLSCANMAMAYSLVAGAASSAAAWPCRPAMMKSVTRSK